jgi:hypothetical protein
VNRSDEPGKAPLSPADIAAIDHLAEEGFDSGQLNGLEGEALARAQAAQSLLSNLDAYPDAELGDDDRTTLVHATMARIRREESLQQDRMRLQPNELVGRGSRMRFRLAEFGAVGAVAAMVAGAAVPMAHMAKDRAVSIGTHRNLSQLHAGVTSWTQANDGHLPTTTASTGVANLVSSDVRQLDMQGVADAGHCSQGCLQNPRRPGVGRFGFSFVIRTEFGGMMSDGSLVLVGDRNPALEGLLQGKPFTEAIGYRKFARRITDHPAVLFVDGHVIDARNGTVDGDHVWNVESAATSEFDVLLAH